MHYILNTTFMVGRPTNQYGVIGGPTKFGQNLNTPKLTNSKFKSGVAYTLTYIKKINDGVEYTFKSSTGEVIIEKFTSCADADAFIASIKGETIPNYDLIYSRIRG